ncbi:dihydroorotase [Symbiobacterium thermophilum]|uniref:Dihydroorotase n=1 Tax=Symbiobacterium thermophilum TaxID=2734 RepID=A0A953LHH1_SYMTR|nr:dihydroorotase [Symbiobacterium thermophilum]MBY6276261.1 dihydroorotase [Symbiobacterium thermophilum]
MSSLLIRGGRLLDPANEVDRVADLLVADGRIRAIGEGLPVPPGATVIETSGKVVAPGFIDVHVHLRVPGQEYKEDMRTGTAAAVRGGFVGVVCMPNTRPVIDSGPLVAHVLDLAAREGLCRVWPAGAITKGSQGEELAEIGEMARAGAVAVTDDGRPVDRAETMRQAMIYARQFDLPVMDHCEDRSLSSGGSMHEGRVSSLLGLKGIPAAAEEVHVARDILLALETGARVHLQHLSSRRSVELVRWGKAQGARVTAEATPHHFALTDQAVADMAYSPNTKMNPPLREEADRQAILEGLADGTIDVIATDHAPHHVDEKDVEYPLAAFGITGLETAVGLALDRLVRPGLVSLEQLILLMSTRPARLINRTPPALVEGAEADITVLDLERTWTVRADEMASRSRNSPFIGWTLTGAPYATVVGGRLRMLEMKVIAG